MFGSLLGWYAIGYIAYIFGGSYPLSEFFRVQNSLCVQVLLSILAALSYLILSYTALHGIQAVGVRQTLRRVTRNGRVAIRPTWYFRAT